MSKPLEAALTKKCKNYFEALRLKHKGFKYHKLSDRFTSAILDFYICYEGRSVWIELKKASGKPRPLQSDEIRTLRRAGIGAFWSDDLQDVIDYIEKYILKLS